MVKSRSRQYIMIAGAILATILLQVYWFRQRHLFVYGDSGLELFYQAKFQLTNIFQYAWSGFNEAGFDGSYNFTTLPHFLLFTFLEWMGLPLWTMQATFFALILLASIFFFYLFCRDLLIEKDAVGYTASMLGALFFTLNPIFAFLFFGNIILSIYAPPFAAALLFVLMRYRKTGNTVYMLVILPIVYFVFAPLFINPSFGVPIVAFAALFFITIQRATRSKHEIALFCTVTLLANAWWMLPLASGVSSYLASASIGMDPVETLRYTSESYASVASFLRYLPFRAHENLWIYKQSDWFFGYFNGITSILIGVSLAVITMIIPIFLADSRRRKALIGGLLSLQLVTIFLMKGSRAPLGSLFLLLSEKIPYWGAFRSAYSKFGVGLVISASILFAIACAGILRIVHKRFKVSWAAPLMAVVLVLLLGWYNWPLLRGDIISDPIRIHKNVVTASVEIPSYYHDAARWLSAQSDRGRVLALPLRPKTYVTFDWQQGYDANEPTHLLLGREMLSRLARCRAPAGALLCTANDRGIDTLIALAPWLNVQYIVHQRDVDTQHGNYDGTLTPHEDIHRLLTNSRELRYAASFGKLDFYEISPGAILPKIYIPTSIISTLPEHVLSSMLAPCDKKYGMLCRARPAVFSQTTQSNIKTTGQALVRTISSGEAEFKRINPTRYQITIRGVRESAPLIFSENFDPRWNAYIVPRSSYTIKRIPSHVTWFTRPLDERMLRIRTILPHSAAWRIPKSQHVVANGYANAWILDFPTLCGQSELCTRNSDGSFDATVVIEYLPQHFFFIGMVISIGSLLLSSSYVLWKKRQQATCVDAA